MRVGGPCGRVGGSLDLDELRAFLAVAETGSLLAAADALGLPRSTLRRRLDDLEARAGVPLLYRGAQGARLTEAGEVVATRGRRILHETSALLDTVRETGTEPTGTLRVLLPIGLPPGLVGEIYGLIRTQHPQLAIETRLAEDPVATLPEGFDIAFHLGERPTSGPWLTRTLLQVPEQLLASPEYLAQRGRPATVSDLAGHELLVWRRPGCDPHALPLLGGGTVPVQPAMVSSDVFLVRQLAFAGRGMVFAPDAPLPDRLEPPGKLEPVLPEIIGRSCPFGVVIPEGYARSPKVRALQEQVLAYLREW